MRPNFFFSGLTFSAGLAQEYVRDLATVLFCINLWLKYSFVIPSTKSAKYIFDRQIWIRSSKITQIRIRNKMKRVDSAQEVKCFRNRRLLLFSSAKKFVCQVRCFSLNIYILYRYFSLTCHWIAAAAEHACGAAQPATPGQVTNLISCRGDHSLRGKGGL